MKTVASCLIITAAFFHSGCTSYRFQGNVAQAIGASNPTIQKYRVENIINRSDNGPLSMGQGAFAMPDPWSIPAVSKRLEESAVCNDVMNRNPSMFSRSSESTPLEVEIRTRNESKGGAWSILFPYLLTLGVFPAWTYTPSQCEIIVTSLTDRNKRQSCVVDFRSDMKLTVFSPIGLISYDYAPGAVSCRTGSGIMEAPHLGKECLANLQAVYTETLAAGIATCVHEIERGTPVTVKAQPDREAVPVKVTENAILKEKILRLKELKDSGILTNDEYEAKRKALIDQL